MQNLIKLRLSEIMTKNYFFIRLKQQLTNIFIVLLYFTTIIRYKLSLEFLSTAIFFSFANFLTVATTEICL